MNYFYAAVPSRPELKLIRFLVILYLVSFRAWNHPEVGNLLPVRRYFPLDARPRHRPVNDENVWTHGRVVDIPRRDMSSRHRRVLPMWRREDIRHRLLGSRHRHVS